jgi:hypothetical protein
MHRGLSACATLELNIVYGIRKATHNSDANDLLDLLDPAHGEGGK